MKIVSKFRDYYDSAQGVGIDKTLVYVRKPRKLKLSKAEDALIKGMRANAPRHDEERQGRWAKDYWTNIFIVGFCGKIFPCVELNIISRSTITTTEKITKLYIYSYEEWVDTITTYNIKELLEDIHSTRYWGNNKKGIMEFFNMGNKYSQFENIFLENKVPIFVSTGIKKLHDMNYSVVANCNLSSLGFYKKMDPFTAYQEVSMYVGGVIPKDTMDMIEISDQSRLEKRGFNECSFRKMPDTRRRKQKHGKIKKKY